MTSLVHLCRSYVWFWKLSFYRFEPLTLIPMQKKLVDFALLSTKERQWLDSYHRTVSFDFEDPEICIMHESVGHVLHPGSNLTSALALSGVDEDQSFGGR